MELLTGNDLTVGQRVEAFAYCSHVEVLQNVTSVGSYREVYHLHGMQSAYLPALIFKQGITPPVDTEMYKDEPVMVKGVISEYKGVLQITIESITAIGNKVDVNDLLASMVDTRLVDEVNDFLFANKSLTHLSQRYLKPALGIEGSLAGTLVLRIQRFLEISTKVYPELASEYMDKLSVLAQYYLTTEGNIDDRLTMLVSNDSKLLRALLFGTKDYPEYEEFVKLHHLLMKPRGYRLEILDSAFDINSNSNSDI